MELARNAPQTCSIFNKDPWYCADITVTDILYYDDMNITDIWYFANIIVTDILNHADINVTDIWYSADMNNTYIQ